jgi:hypothetical protein
MAIVLVVIGDSSINAYIYILLMVISDYLLVVIGAYFIDGYWWLLVDHLLVVIGGDWLLFY